VKNQKIAARIHLKISGEDLIEIILAVNGTLMLGESYVIPEQKEIFEFGGWRPYI
jgi:hypothetical protein